MPYVDQSFLPTAQALLACLSEAVVDLSAPPAVVGMRYGNEVAFDLSQNEDVCCDGLAWVRMGTASPGWPAADSSPVRCSVAAWALELEVGIVRCAPMGDDEFIVTEAQHAATAAALAEDFMAIRRAVCCFTNLFEASLGAWTPVGPAGGCVGSTLTVTALVVGNDVFP